MEKEIKVIIKNVYGEDKVYPVCSTAKLLAELAGTKTLLPRHFVTLRRLGYVIKPVTQRKVKFLNQKTIDLALESV